MWLIGAYKLFWTNKQTVLIIKIFGKKNIVASHPSKQSAQKIDIHNKSTRDVMKLYMPRENAN